MHAGLAVLEHYIVRHVDHVEGPHPAWNSLLRMTKGLLAIFTP